MSGESSSFLFVYGTLMTGECRYPLLVPGEIVAIERASVPGTLFHLGSYPGLLLSQCLDGTRVFGELIEFRHLDTILPDLDREEGDEYRRELLVATRPDGSVKRAWCYVLAKKTDTSRHVIESGDWRSC